MANILLVDRKKNQERLERVMLDNIYKLCYCSYIANYRSSARVILTSVIELTLSVCIFIEYCKCISMTYQWEDLNVPLTATLSTVSLSGLAILNSG